MGVKEGASGVTRLDDTPYAVRPNVCFGPLVWMIYDPFVIYDFRFLNGSTSCQYGMGSSARSGHGYALCIYDLLITYCDRLSSA